MNNLSIAYFLRKFNGEPTRSATPVTKAIAEKESFSNEPGIPENVDPYSDKWSKNYLGVG